MNQLIQTETMSIVYGEDKEELFRCPINLEGELSDYVNRERCLVKPMGASVPFVDDDTKEINKVDGMVLIGYWRMYFRDRCWGGRWIFEEAPEKGIACNPEKDELEGVNRIIDWIRENFNHGCDFVMDDFFKLNFRQRCANRYFIKPFMSKYYKVLVDTTYGNADYPVRIYVYRNIEE